MPHTPVPPPSTPLSEIYAFRAISDRIGTAGQPTAAQLKQVLGRPLDDDEQLLEELGSVRSETDRPPAPHCPLHGERAKTHFYSGASIYSLTPTTLKIAQEMADEPATLRHEMSNALKRGDRSNYEFLMTQWKLSIAKFARFT